jgi:hypothetical protein
VDKKIDLHEIDKRIQIMKKTADELKRLGENFPAVNKNTDRLLAAVKMMELNVCDVCNLD